jgi:L-amino acid N-acyltransferase YncA
MKKTDLVIRPSVKKDVQDLWDIFRPVLEKGDAYIYDINKMDLDRFEEYWFAPERVGFVAELNGEIVGGYTVRPNFVDLASHIANASYIVSPNHQGKGVGRHLGMHSIAKAKELGYRGMQFNLVVSTNTPAVNLWKSLGFEVIATIPGGFKHHKHGYVDHYIMFRSLL